jgi:phosphocarrier protein
MIKVDTTIINRLGLHARAAARFVNLASEYDSDIWIAKDGREVNGKSIMGVMMLAASKGSNIALRADGRDEQQAIDALQKLIGNRFDEDE